MKYLMIKLLDRVALFSNLLDNVIKACEKSEKAFLRIDCYPNRNYFVIKVVNSKMKEDSIHLPNPIAFKKDSETHGFGLHIIKNIVEKYDGDIQILNEDEVASIEIIIKNT